MLKGEQWNIIAKFLNKEKLSAGEEAEFEAMAADEEVQRIIRQSARTFEKVDLFLSLEQYNTPKAWKKVNSVISGKRTLTLLPLLRVAAIFILLLACGITLWQLAEKSADRKLEFATSLYDRSNPELTLPDGTTVTLNQGTRIVYPKTFRGDTRKITLEGEAYFNVTPDPQKPFIIETGQALVRVLGTTFNVCAYGNLETVEVIVQTGRVELGGGSSDKVLLIAGQKGIMNKSSRQLTCEEFCSPNNLSWITHEVSFSHTPLNEVFETLRKVYNVRIEVDAKVDLNKQINATFTEQDPDYILDVVALTLGLQLDRKEPQRYTVRNN